MLVSFGMSEEKAYESIKCLVGNTPEDIKIPVTLFEKKKFIKNIKRLIFSKNKSKLSKKEKHDMVINLVNIVQDRIEEIKKLDNNGDLFEYQPQY